MHQLMRRISPFFTAFHRYNKWCRILPSTPCVKFHITENGWLGRRSFPFEKVTNFREKLAVKHVKHQVPGMTSVWPASLQLVTECHHSDVSGKCHRVSQVYKEVMGFILQTDTRGRHVYLCIYLFIYIQLHTYGMYII